jgi:hypothetical protein
MIVRHQTNVAGFAGGQHVRYWSLYPVTSTDAGEGAVVVLSVPVTFHAEHTAPPLVAAFSTYDVSGMREHLDPDTAKQIRPGTHPEG